MPTLLISLFSSFVSRDIINIITGEQAGEIVKPFAIMIGLGIGTSFTTQISTYASTRISMRVNAQLKNEIFEKIYCRW